MDFSGIADRLSQSPVTAIPVLFAAGVLTSLTPCIYPMIPITVGVIVMFFGFLQVGQQTQTSA